MGTDFFDDDGKKRIGVDDRKELTVSSDEIRSDVLTSRMARQRSELNAHVSGAVQEIEFLRRKQDELEKEKKLLEEWAHKQEDYEKGKRDIVEKLERGVILIEKEEVQATRIAELMAVMRDRFKDTLAELQALDEESWSDQSFQAELDKAMVLVEDARATYRKALAKIEAAGWKKSEAMEKPNILEEAESEMAPDPGFFYWLKAGFAASLPLILVAIALFVAWLVLSGQE